MQIATPDQYRRTLEALAQTVELISKEEAYRVDLQNQAYLDSLRSHAAKLGHMLQEYRRVA